MTTSSYADRPWHERRPMETPAEYLDRVFPLPTPHSGTPAGAPQSVEEIAAATRQARERATATAKEERDAKKRQYAGRTPAEIEILERQKLLEYEATLLRAKERDTAARGKIERVIPAESGMPLRLVLSFDPQHVSAPNSEGTITVSEFAQKITETNKRGELSVTYGKLSPAVGMTGVIIARFGNNPHKWEWAFIAD